MVSRIVSVLVIAIAVVAIGAGVLQNRSASPPLAVHVTAAPDQKAPRSGVLSKDRFAHYPVVVACSSMDAQPRRNPVVRLFIVGAGEKKRDDQALFSLAVPSAIVVAPFGSDAKQVIARARQYGSPIFLQLYGPLGTAQIARDRTRLGPVQGYAGRNASQALQALVGSGLSFFDERGKGQAKAFQTAGIRYFGRSVTADNDQGSGYIAFMLKRAVTMSRSCGPVNVLLRATTASLRAARKALNETPLGDAVTLAQ